MKKLLILLSLSLVLAFCIVGCTGDDGSDTMTGWPTTWPSEEPNSAPGSYLRGSDLKTATEILTHGTHHDLQTKLTVQA